MTLPVCVDGVGVYLLARDVVGQHVGEVLLGARARLAQVPLVARRHRLGLQLQLGRVQRHVHAARLAARRRARARRRRALA